LSETSNIAIIIPAAGASSRLGSPKQLLKWRDTTLLSHCLQTASSAACKEIFLVLGAYKDEIREQLPANNAIILENPNWESGLGSSIALAMKQIIKSSHKIDAALIMLPDQPLVDSGFLKKMLQTFIPGHEQIIASVYEDGRIGVPAMFDKTYFKELSALRDDKGARKLITENLNKVTAIPGEGKLKDIDTREAYETLYRANHQ